MKPAPDRMGSDMKVLYYSPIDERHRFTITSMGPIAGLAICYNEAEQDYFLFGCDSKLNEVTDTWHQTLEEAMSQAESEYEGISKTWVKKE
jgi:hypothetical protein